MNRKILLWTRGVDDLMLDKSNIGGLTVQMHFWATTFVSNGWKVYSFSKDKSRKLNDIHFLSLPVVRYLGVFIELFLSFYYIVKVKPKVIIYRGADRILIYVVLLSKLYKSKLIYFGASDSDFQPKKELIKSTLDKRLFEFGLRNVEHFVVQNFKQKRLLEFNYKRSNALVVPNIWEKTTTSFNVQNNNYILWVGNFRELKRPVWFLKLVDKFPDIHFVMIGGATDKELYNRCKLISQNFRNCTFLGAQSFNTVNSYFSKARLLVCTSEMEGFPNTFLQAWCNNIPVLTTYDPSDIVQDNKLGIFVDSLDLLIDSTRMLIENNEYYNSLQNNIKKYFLESHNTQNAYNLIENRFKL